MELPEGAARGCLPDGVSICQVCRSMSPVLGQLMPYMRREIAGQGAEEVR